MTEYIEREALLSELQEELEFESPMYTEEQNKYFNGGLKCAIRDVKSQPTADVAEVRHGKWVDRYGEKHSNHLYECSECKKEALYTVKVNELGSPKVMQALSAVCPNCGARMDGNSQKEVE